MEVLAGIWIFLQTSFYIVCVVVAIFLFYKNYKKDGGIAPIKGLENIVVDPNDELAEVKREMKRLNIIDSHLFSLKTRFYRLLNEFSASPRKAWENFKNPESKTDEINALYQEKVVKPVVRSILPNAVVALDRHMSLDSFLGDLLLPKHDGSDGSGLIKYASPGDRFIFSNIELEERRVDSDGRDDYVIIFRGQAFGLKFKTKLQGSVRIVSTDRIIKSGPEVSRYKKKQKNEVKVETEGQYFNEQFDVYATDQSLAFYVVSPPLMERLSRLREKFHPMSVGIIGDNLFITLRTGQRYFSVPYRSDDIDAISKEKVRDEFVGVYNLALDLRDIIEGNTNN